MQPCYDLLSEPWAPCLLPSGRVAHLGLAETLHRAPEIVEVLDASPLVTAALHRLLLAILHRVLGPASEDEWLAHWHRGRWPAEPLEEYLGAWRHRFDLLHPKWPFGQVAGLSEKLRGPVSRLVLPTACRGAATLFDHTTDERASLPPAEAARQLLAYQAFAPCGGAGVEGGMVVCRAAPWSAAAVVLPRGDNLFQSLMLALLPYDPAGGRPFPGTGEDRPRWEQSAAQERGERLPLGYLDYLTWPARQVLLQPERSPGGAVLITQAAVTAGCDLASTGAPADPLLAYDCSRIPGREGCWLPWRFDRYRPWWRDSLYLLSAATSQVQRPAVMDWVAHLADGGLLPPHWRFSVSLLGLCGERAKVFSWRHQRQVVPLSYLVDEDLCADLARAMQQAEGVYQAFRAALWLLARTQAGGQGHQPPQTHTLRRRAAGGPLTQSYWTTLELPFRVMLANLPGSLAHRSEQLSHWSRQCCQAAGEAFEACVPHRGTSAGASAAIVQARRQLAQDLRQLAAQIQEECCLVPASGA